MNNNKINIIEAGKELGLYPRIVTSMKAFDNYNAFFNIYGESEEPCRRIVVLTPYKELEEVNDEDPSQEIEEYKIIDNNIWLKEFTLTINPNKISLESIVIDKSTFEKIKKEYNKL